jgi:hypothetical protein
LRAWLPGGEVQRTMVRTVQGACGVSLGLLKGVCRQPAVARCVYCNYPFCADHGERGADHTDSCSRRLCRRKARDLAAHQIWRESAQQPNRVSGCAHEECTERMRHQCSRCRLMFCDEHVHAVSATPGRSSGTADVQIAICDHCRKRDKLWR